MIGPVKDQPILFTSPSVVDPCCGPSDWAHGFFAADLIPFQFLVGPQDGAENLISNPTFNSGSFTVQDDWTAEGAILYNIGGDGVRFAGFSGSIEQTGFGGGDFNPGDWYLLRIVIANPTTSISANTILVEGFEDPITIIGNAQVFETYAKAGLNANLKLTFTGLADAANDPLFEIVRVSEISILPIEIPQVTTETKDGTLLSTVFTKSYDAPFLSVFFQPGEDEIAAKCFRFRVENEAETEVFISELIEIVGDNQCTVLVGGCSNNNLYSPESDLFVRLKGKLLADQAPTYDRFTTRTNSGRHRLNYGRKTKVWTLYIDRVPEHVRDFIYSFPLFNTIGIKEGTAPQRNFFVSEEPDAPEFTVTDDKLASVTLTLVEKESLQESIYTGECNFILPPKALGSQALQFAIKAATDSAFLVP